MEAQGTLQYYHGFGREEHGFVNTAGEGGVMNTMMIVGIVGLGMAVIGGFVLAGAKDGEWFGWALLCVASVYMVWAPLIFISAMMMKHK